MFECGWIILVSLGINLASPQGDRVDRGKWESAPSGESLTGQTGPELKVEVQQTALREKPMVFSAVIAELKEGDVLTSLGASGAWVQVKTKSGQQGWVHKTAVAKRQRIKFTVEGSGDAPSDPGKAEAYAAAKGFNEDMEREYKKEKKLEPYFVQVDWIEQNPGYVTDKKKLDAMLRQFRQAGKLGEY